MNQKISDLTDEELVLLLQCNYCKIGMDLEPDSWDEESLVRQVKQYQRNMWVSAFNDMFTKYAEKKLNTPLTLKPAFSGYFIAQLRQAFFNAILGYKKKNPASAAPRKTWRFNTQNKNTMPVSIGELVKRNNALLK